jgi:hypothetical protein
MKRWMPLFLLADKLTFCKVCVLVEKQVREAKRDGKYTERCEDMGFLPASCEKQAMFALSPLCYIVELNLEMPITSPK